MTLDHYKHCYQTIMLNEQLENSAIGCTVIPILVCGKQCLLLSTEFNLQLRFIAVYLSCYSCLQEWCIQGNPCLLVPSRKVKIVTKIGSFEKLEVNLKCSIEANLVWAIACFKILRVQEIRIRSFCGVIFRVRFKVQRA